jgi:HSP20 family protein
MAETKEKSKITPVKKEAERLHPKRLLTPFEDMEHWAEDFFPRGWLRQHRWDWPVSTGFSTMLEERMPKVDIIDRDNEVFIKAELPGIDKKDVEVSVTDHTITIKGSSRKEEKEEKGDYYRSEITQGAFSRSLPLPAEVNIDKSQAKFKDGVLELTLPKIESTKRRSIKID